MAAAIVLDTSASMAFPACREQSGYGPFSGVVEVPLRGHRGGGAGAPDLAAGRRRRPAAPRDTARLSAAARRPASICARLLAALTSLDAARRVERRRNGAARRRAAETARSADRAVGLLRRRGADVRGAAAGGAHGPRGVLFQILSRDELELPYRRDLEFADLETGRTLAVNAGLARRDYKDAVAAFLERWRSARRRGRVSVFAGRHRHAAGSRAAQYPARAAAIGLSIAEHTVIWLEPAAADRDRGGRRAGADSPAGAAPRGALSVSDAALSAADAARRDSPPRAREICRCWRCAWRSSPRPSRRSQVRSSSPSARRAAWNDRIVRAIVIDGRD